MKKLLFSICICISGYTQANNLLELTLNPHTSRTIKVNNPAQTNWQFEITPITQQNLVTFTDANSVPIPVNTFIPVQNNFYYGFSFSKGADFDIIYSVTAISYDTDAYVRGNPKCVFLLTGLKPAVPENYVNNFAGAACKFEKDANGNLNLILDKTV